MNNPNHLSEHDFNIRMENEFEGNQNFGKECESYSLTVENDNLLNSSNMFTLTCKLCTENHYSRKSNDRKKLMAAYRTHKYRHHSEKGRIFLEKLQSGNTNLSEIQLDPNFSSLLIGSSDKENTVLNEELVNKLTTLIEKSEQKNIEEETEKQSTLTNFIKLEPDILQE